MIYRLSILLAALLLAGAAAAAEELPPSPFVVTASLSVAGPAPVVRLQFDFPKDCVVYADHLHFLTADGEEIAAINLPAPITDVDKASGEERQMFDRPFSADVQLPAPHTGDLVVRLQGCSNSVCFFPEKHLYTVTPAAVTAADKPVPAVPVVVSPKPNAFSANWRAEAKSFRVIARETGYIRSADFIPFLHRSATAAVGTAPRDPLALFRRAGLVLPVLLIVGGGIALNFTPCVLPLVPVNLAIIGAGASAGTRRQGFLHGAIYGAGMALVYGVLGLAVVLTGAKFGALNSSAWFNAGIAAVFGVLALAMFGVLNLDFSRLGGRWGDFNGAGRSRSVAAFLFGGMAALLAGACVAPVVISVLLFAADLYAKGRVIGLALPFLLGIGMALPWPFAGASLTLLPKPGKWMTRVKAGFGVLILGFGVYCARRIPSQTSPPRPAWACPSSGPTSRSPARWLTPGGTVTACSLIFRPVGARTASPWRPPSSPRTRCGANWRISSSSNIRPNARMNRPPRRCWITSACWACPPTSS
ncbi:MAG: protein-disulfide reductase DsbD family protein [Verrucomicrobia bacterium]|nr:protein-disulfide reductase DsbD family protein [Verrucomicrobiota bacterium]